MYFAIFASKLVKGTLDRSEVPGPAGRSLCGYRHAADTDSDKDTLPALHAWLPAA